ncbi:MAG TPA: serine/threonine protein kinase [Candidatus Angelobacter sp.]|nr:serine/threonine protein kinase [Candidatus Angelobacter sp.]
MHSVNRTVMDSEAVTLVHSALPTNQATLSQPQETISKGIVTINSWNEWDPLKHVIVGRADGAVVQAPEIAVQRDWPEYGFPLGSHGRIPQHMVDAANEQLDNLAAILQKRGVRVDRPAPLDFSQTVMTPDWVQESMFGCMPPRDVLLVVGNEILEATMSFRSRWFEYLCYRPLVEHYFHADQNMKWEAAPKPRLTDRSYKSGFWQEYNSLPLDERLHKVRQNDLLLTETEPLFDAADVSRFGKDLFVQLSMVTNRSGVQWLRKHFPEHRIHEVIFDEDGPFHIDATWVPLRPGLVLHNGERAASPELIKFFHKNDWDVVEGAQPAKTKTNLPPLCFCSQWLSMNMLSLDPNTVFVEQSETAQMELLYHLGLEVIPVPFWDVAPFGGGLHCSTIDVFRAGTLEDYFPSRVGIF